MANSSFDLSSFMPEQELVELLWEDGQIVMQGQSNRTRKSSIGTDSTLNGRVEDTDDVTIAKLGQTGAAAHDLLRSVPSAMISQEDEATHWMNYPIDDDDALQNDYCSEFFSEITGAMSSLANTNTSINQSAKDSHAFRSSPRVSDPTKPRYVHQIFPETARSKTVDLDGSKRIQKVSQKNHGAGVLNFSHFSRPAALVKANLHSIERLQESSNGKSMVNRPSFAASENKARNEGERKVEAVVVSSSTSNDGKQKSKKRTREGDESGEQSDELDNESFAVKELSSLRGASGKRSRAAEVHNLSERRRRDRINEKMKALQELIPNCNKVDKASMLDEAIEYLKTLQLQVQMMSMGSGLCMAPMMLPAGMNLQHLRSSQMASFSPLGVGMGIGMGMGLGFGMGMIDLNGSPGLVPVSPQFPCPSVPGVSGLYGMPAQRLPVSASQPSFFNSQRSSLNPWQVLDPAPSSSQNKQQATQTSQAACPKDGEEMHGSRGSAANPVFDGGSIKGGG